MSAPAARNSAPTSSRHATMAPSRSRVLVATLNAATLAAVVGLATSCARPPLSEESTPAPVRSATVVIRGTVVVEESGAPLEAAEVRVTRADTDSLLGAVLTRQDGGFEVRVPRLEVGLLVRRIGFGPQRRTIDASSHATDTLAVAIRLPEFTRWYSADIARQIAELQKPTEVTPCRPANSTAVGIGNHIRRLISESDIVTLALFGLADLRGTTVEHVIDLGRCRAATEAIAKAARIASDGLQVHLFRLGEKGWIAYEASFLGGHYSSLFVLDRDLTRLRITLAF